MSTNLEAVERRVPGVRAVRTYRRAWLRPDLVAGVVLAAILVPQGMAYAELAGLPAGHRPLHDDRAASSATRVFGPSRVLVLGPDSSISPLIFAAIIPLVVPAATRRRAIALAGMLALLVGLIEIGLGLGKLGFVADLLSSEVQVGYMNGLGDHDHRRASCRSCSGSRPTPTAFVDEVRAVRSSTSTRRTPPRSSSASAVLVVLLVLPRITTQGPGDPRRGRRRHGRLGRARPRRRRVATVGIAAAGGSRRRRSRGPSIDDVGPAARRRGRHHAGLADRHDRDRRRASRPGAATRSTRTRR